MFHFFYFEIFLVRESALPFWEREAVTISILMENPGEKEGKEKKSSAGLTEEPGTKTLIVGDNKFSGLCGIIGKQLQDVNATR